MVPKYECRFKLGAADDLYSHLRWFHSPFFHRNSQVIHVFFGQYRIEFAQMHYSKAFHALGICGQNKNLKIWMVSGKKCYFVLISTKLTQEPDNDRYSRRIPGDFRLKRSLSSAGCLQKAALRRRGYPLCNEQGFGQLRHVIHIKELGSFFGEDQDFE
jgi:hypothetical protein